jgi:phosphate:Na+ symporter
METQNTTGIDIWELLAGIGIFLFGIHLLEESIKRLSGHAFKNFIRRYTSSPVKALISGTVSTAVLQSSSAVTLMVLAFAGAGIMQLQNAIGVILGANLGTTLTSWIVATIGFKIKIESLALPVIGIGGLLLIFLGKSEKWANFSKLLVGFGFLFMGLDYMKSSIEGLAATFDFSAFIESPIILFIGIGFVLTAVVQSSSAAVAIILSVLFSGAISFDKAAAMIIGTNMGTTLTIIIGSIGGPAIKKQVGLSHFLFNFITGIVAWIILPMLIKITFWIGSVDDPVIGLAIFHTLFNFLGILLFLPFIPLMGNLMTKWVSGGEERRRNILHHINTEVPEAAISAIETVYNELLLYVIDHNLRSCRVDSLLVLDKPKYQFLRQESTLRKQYDHIKEVQNDLLVFGAKVQQSPLNQAESIRLHQLLHSIRFLHASAKSVQDASTYLDELFESEQPFLQHHVQIIKKFTLHTYQNLYGVIEDPHHENMLPALLKIRSNIKLEDEKWMSHLLSRIQTEELPHEDTNLYFAVNRGIILSQRQIVSALRDGLLYNEEAGLFDTISN